MNEEINRRLGEKLKGKTPKKTPWPKIEKCLRAGLNKRRTAAHVGMTTKDLDEACLLEQEMNWDDYEATFAAAGEGDILMRQHEKAMQGDNSMLQWIGKQRCGQVDRTRTDITIDLFTKLSQERGDELPPAELSMEEYERQQLERVRIPIAGNN